MPTILADSLTAAGARLANDDPEPSSVDHLPFRTHM